MPRDIKSYPTKKMEKWVFGSIFHNRQKTNQKLKLKLNLIALQLNVKQFRIKIYVFILKKLCME